MVLWNVVGFSNHKNDWSWLRLIELNNDKNFINFLLIFSAFPRCKSQSERSEWRCGATINNFFAQLIFARNIALHCKSSSGSRVFRANLDLHKFVVINSNWESLRLEEIQDHQNQLLSFYLDKKVADSTPIYALYFYFILTVTSW